MNVIIANERQDELANLDIEIIKSIRGVYEAEELVQIFSNFFFGRMILDLTAIKDYKDITNLQKFALSLDVEKMIVLLPDVPECLAPQFLSQLISIGIYNFTTNLEGVKYLLDNPNTYRDVAHLHQINMQQPIIVNAPAGADNNMAQNTMMTNQVIQTGTFVLGIKNITDHSGATMLAYMLKNEIKNMGKSVVAIEIGKRDFTYFNDPDMISTTKELFSSELAKHRNKNVVLVDLNKDGEENLCNDVLYLLEPSTIKLNKLMLGNRTIFEKLAGKKIVINKNIMGNGDIKELEFEARFKSFYILPPLDERANNSEVLQKLLSSLGIINY